MREKLTLKIGVLLIGFTLIFSGHTFGQLTTENALTVEEYVQTVLLGEGVTVSNVTYNGLPGDQVSPRVGYFNGENSDFYFDEGLIMATKNVQIATCGDAIDGSGQGADPDLSQLISFNLNDVTVIEFDFIPQGDTLNFGYIFASREYNGFVCSSFNDVFGFFLSGPGINGPFTSNAENIAVLPDGTPVTINTVNNGANDWASGGSGVECTPPGATEPCPCNSQFFTDNGSGNGTALHSDVCYGGYTVPMVAEAIVECGLEYHIKLAIANASDGALDSGVFLQAGSFASSSTVDIDLQIDGGLNDTTLVEGCGGATFIFNRQQENVEQTIYLSMEGDATNGLDYTDIPDSLVFPVGVTQITFDITAFDDGLIEGLELVILEVENENICGGQNLQSDFEFYIDEFPVMEVEGFDGLVDCGEPIELEPEVTGGDPPYSFLWNTGETTSAITVAPDASTVFTVTVTDSCGVYQESVDFNVEVPVYEELTVDIGPDWPNLTCITDVLIDPDINGGSGDFTFEWLDNGVLAAEEEIWTELPQGNGQLQFTVTDHCGNTATDEVLYQTPPVQVFVDLGPDYFVSCVDNTPITSSYSGGIGEYSFAWFIDGALYDTIPAIQYNTDVTQEIVLVVTDECGNFQSDTVMVNVPDIPLEFTLSPDTTICVGDQAVLTAEAVGGEGGIIYEWQPYGYTEPQIFVSPEDTTTYSVMAYDICGDSIGGEVTVNATFVEAAFAFDYVGENGAVFTNLSTPDVNYLWNFGDGLKSHLFEPTHEYFSPGVYQISLYVTDSLGCSDLVSQQYNPPMFLYIPNSFTPNGDGINEVFKAKGVAVKTFEMWIYNRQGEMLFHTTDIEESWDGSANGSDYYVPNGVYVVKYKAESYEGQDVEETGRVTVIR